MRAILTFTAALAFGISPLLAGTVYVSVTDHFEVAGKTIVHEVLITNTDGKQSHSLSTLFIPSGEDGLDREGMELGITHVRGGATVFIDLDTVDEIGTGLLEIDADDSLTIGSRLLIFDDELGGPPLIVDLPVLSSRNVAEANTYVDLLGLERTNNGKTHVSIVNLGHEDSSCTVKFIKAGGLNLSPNMVIAFPPLSQRLFDDTFALINVNKVVDARMRTTCDQPFFVAAAITTVDLDVARVIRPAQAGTSSLIVPGNEPDPVFFNVNGNFLTPSLGGGKSFREFTLPLEPLQDYASIALEFDMLLGQWHTDLFHAVVIMRRRGKPPLYFALTLRADNQRTVFDLGDETVLREFGNWQTNSKYHMKITYNAASGNLDFVATKGGKRSSELSGSVAATDLGDDTGDNPVILIFGLSKVYDNAYFPPWGWEFSNLKVTAIPKTIQ